MGLFSKKQSAAPPATLVLRNTTPAPIEIMIEVNPDRYVLKPGDKMAVAAQPGQDPFDVTLYEGGVQIYPGADSGPAVSINDEAVEPWDTPGSDSN